jgi:diguanylate cyclase (GGDEF)-like protein
MKRLAYYKVYGLVLLAFLVLTTWWVAILLNQRNETLVDARTSVVRQVQLVGTGMGAFASGIDNLLDDLLGRISANDLDNARQDMLFQSRWVPTLAYKLARTPYLHGVSLFDKNCVFIASADSTQTGHQLTQADCNGLRAASGTDQMQIRFIGPDATVMGNSLVAFARVYPTGSGKFIGGATAAIDLQFLRLWLGNHVTKTGETLMLVTRDSRVLAQAGWGSGAGPRPPDNVFEQYPALKLAMLPGIESRVLNFDSEFIGISHVKGSPFFVLSRLGKAEALAGWYRQLNEAVLAAAALLVLLVLLARSYSRVLRQKYQLEQLSVTDELTGLFNRRYLIGRGEEQASQGVAHQSGLAVLLIDADRFKAINDQWGHAVGDSVLRQLAGRLAAGIRGTDILARYGGEEFAVLLPGTDAAGARRIAERIRQAVAHEPVQTDSVQIPVTVSVGMAVLMPGESFESLIGRADHALYDAKGAGRNRISVAGVNSGSWCTAPATAA